MLLVLWLLLSPTTTSVQASTQKHIRTNWVTLLLYCHCEAHAVKTFGAIQGPPISNNISLRNHYHKINPSLGFFSNT